MTVRNDIDSWSETTVAQEFEVQLGKRLDAAVNRGVLKPCINNRGVRWGRVSVTEAVLAPLTEQDVKDLRLVAGDVLVCEGGEIGRSSVWNDELPEAYFLNTLHRLRSKGTYEPQLLVAFLERWANTGSLLALVGKSSLAHLTKKNLLQVNLPIPPPAEQSRVVRAITAADQSVKALERLIAKKQAIKHGMMQQLLTGKTRLPGFTEGWVHIRLGTAVGRLKAGVSVNSGSLSGSKAVLKTSCVSKGRFRPEERKTIAPSDLGRARVSPVKGSLIISRMNTPDLVGEVGYVASDWPNLFLPDRLWLATPSRDSSVDLRWLGYLLSSPHYSRRLKELATGTSGSMKNIAKPSLFNLMALCPPRDEQKAIVRVLAGADDELDALELRLAKAKAVKQGMLQELLTGRTRLPIAEVAAS